MENAPAKSPFSLTGISGAPKPTIDTFLTLLNERFGDTIRFNALSGRAEVLDDNDMCWIPWTDTHDAGLRWHFQATDGLAHKENLVDAFRLFLDQHKVNPLTDLIDTLQWDGTPRIAHFLTKVMKADDSPYIREVSRLIFAGGIHRAYNPGCKFDDMPVLIGEKQGEGKTTVVRWLAMEDDYFREVTDMSGREGIETLSGAWICEVGELLAMTRVKESEAVKSYITRQEDTYRAPYDRHPQTKPRRCIFIGTTNNAQFLSDKTGNRRFYPVRCHCTGYDLFNNKAVIKEYIRQCWAEARTLYKENNLPPYADRDLLPYIREEQERAMEDDYRIGMIRSYMDGKPNDSTVSVIELWFKALLQDGKSRPSRKDSIEIMQIASRIPGWERCEKTMRTEYGIQKVLIKRFNAVEKPSDCPF